MSLAKLDYCRNLITALYSVEKKKQKHVGYFLRKVPFFDTHCEDGHISPLHAASSTFCSKNNSFPYISLYSRRKKKSTFHVKVTVVDLKTYYNCNCRALGPGLPYNAQRTPFREKDFCIPKRTPFSEKGHLL